MSDPYFKGVFKLAPEVTSKIHKSGKSHEVKINVKFSVIKDKQLTGRVDPVLVTVDL